jgi:short-subunit dehydrogenase
MSNSGQVVIVTGASEGIGRALCLELAARRDAIALAARNEARLAEVAEECRARGGEVLVVPTDVSRKEDCRALIDATVTRFGRIDTLVNNAGMSMWSRLDEIADLDVFETLMKVNYLGCVYATYYALPALKQSRGRIVVVASLAGITGVPTRTGYAATKHAVFGFFDSLRIELAETGVSVTLVAPDFVVSEIHRRSLGPDGQPLVASPMQESRIMTSEECARMIVKGMDGRRRLVIGSRRGRLGRFVRLIAPALIDRMAAKAIREGR